MASSNRTGPPVPDLPTVNGIDTPDHIEEEVVNSDDEVQCHTSSSLSRTDPMLTPPSSRVALASIKQKMDFTEPHPMRAASWTTPPDKPLPSVSAASAPASLHGVEPDKSSEIDNSASVSVILSRLDTVRGYIIEAEQLYEQLQEQYIEGEDEDKLKRVATLIHQLKHQELSYLQVLLKLMEDTPTNEVETDDDDENVPELNEANESLSLKAELLKDDDEITEEQQKQLLALQEQHVLLKKLLEQQKQLDLLQAKQTHLLSLKKEAEAKLALVDQQRNELSEPEEFNDNVEKQHLLSKLNEMKSQKAQIDQLLNQIQTIKSSPNTSKMADSIIAQETGLPASNEIVTETDELQSKVKSINDAREKLTQLQKTISEIQSSVQSPDKTDHTLQSLQTKSAPQLEVANDDDNETGVSELLAQYEEGIAEKEKELDMLRSQREELKQVEEMLQNLHLLTNETKDDTTVANEEETVQMKLEQELKHQRELYDTLLKKTTQLQQLQQDIERLSRGGSDQDSGGMVDTTAATWGGSSSRASDDSLLNITRDSLEPSTATVEHNDKQDTVNYRVDRHTPRNPRQLRRAYSPHDENEIIEGKKMKLEPQISGSGSTRPLSEVTNSSTVVPRPGAVYKHSAVWPSVIFSQQNKVENKLPTKLQETANKDVPLDYISLLQHQLQHSTNMCKQLMEQQSELMTALHKRLDTLPYIQEQLVQLQQYHDYLQGYNEYLNNAYWQLTEFQKNVSSRVNNEEPYPPTSANESHNNSVLEPLAPPFPFPKLTSSYALSQVKSPFPRPSNPHLLSTPNVELRPSSQLNDDNVGSTSSLPISVPEKESEFDDLKDTIYSEVAALIGMNEDRPHYLIELFSGLQLLSSDYLKQRALISIQDIIAQHLKESDFEHNKINQSNSAKFDYVEVVESASSLSTPPISDEPFAKDSLSNTVIKVESDTTPLKAMISGGSSDLDTSLLDDKIKSIMTDLIPVLKEYVNNDCTNDIINHILQYIMDTVLSKVDIEDNSELKQMFAKQLEISIKGILTKYINKRIGTIGEDMLVDISEVLFNELSYYELLKDQGLGIPKDWNPNTIMCNTRNIDPTILQVYTSVMSQSVNEEQDLLSKMRDDELAKSWGATTTVLNDVNEHDNDKD